MEGERRYTPCSGQRPCPVCAGGTPCQVSDDGWVECCNIERTGTLLSAPRGLRIDSQFDHPFKGALYAPTGERLQPRTRTQAAEKARDDGMRRARGMWSRASKAGRNHDRLIAYMAHRGIKVSLLPGGVAPHEHAYLADCYESWDKLERKPLLWAPGAIVSRSVQLVEREGGVRLEQTGVHCIYLDSDGPGKRSEAEGNPKKMHGPSGGRVVCLAKGWGDGTLIITEGIETGWAVLQATGATTWAGLSANYFPKLARSLPASLFTPRGDTPPPIHTVIFAADLNRSALNAASQTEFIRTLRENYAITGATAKYIAAMPTGERWASIAQAILFERFPWLQTHVKAPSAAVVPQLVELHGDRDRPIEGSAVDWLDVLNVGAGGMEAVRAGVLGGVDVAAARAAVVEAHATSGARTPETPPPLGPGGHGASAPVESLEPAAPGGGRGGIDDPAAAGLMWEEEDDGGNKVFCISPGAQDRARLFLLQECVIEGARRFRLVYWAGKFFWYEEGRWAALEEKVQLYGRVKQWLSRFHTVRHLKNSTEVKRLHPTVRMVEEIIRDLAAEAFVNVTSMPAWLPPSFAEDGKPLWGSAVRRFRQYSSTQGGDPGDWLVYTNGRINSRELVAGRVAMVEATPDLFTFAARPYPLDVQLLERVIREGFTEGIAKMVCPNFWRWLNDATDGDKERMACLQKMFGDTASGWRAIEKIFLVPGPKRGGKDLIQDALAASNGEETIAATTFFDLSDRFGLAPLVGASTILLPDAHVVEFRDGGMAVERLKTISGNGRLSIRDLYIKATANVKVRGRIWIFVNDEPDKLTDNSGALAGRLIVWPLTRTFFGREDLALKPAVSREGPGINLWALRGLVDLWRMERPAIVAPARGQEIQQEIERNSSPMSGFLADCCQQQTPGGKALNVRLGAAYAMYERWCGKNDRKPVGRNKFIARLRPLVPEIHVDQPEQSDGTRPRTINGLTLKHESEMPDELFEEDAADKPVTSTAFGTMPKAKPASIPDSKLPPF